METPVSDEPAPTQVSWCVVGVVAIVLFVASLLPVPFGRHPKFGRLGPDKVLHFVGHGGFAAAIANALQGTRLAPREATMLAIGVSTGYGILLGQFQERIPGRTPEAADAIAGLLGSLVGGIGWARWESRANRG